MGTRLLLSLILLGFGSAVLAQQEIEQEFEFDIPPQAVHTALTEFAEQADLTLVFPDEVVLKKSANTLIGKYTLQEGIDILLAGTGLTPMFSDHIVLSISADQQLTNKGNTMNKNKKAPLLKRLGTAIAAAIFATSGGAAIAADDATADSNEAVIEEIVVTATRRDTSLQDTASAITAFTTEDLYRQGIETFDDFARQTPGLNLTGPNLNQKFTIRGIQTNSGAASTGNQNPVAVYYDEVPVSTFSVVTPDLRLYDVERVEVLRGPQGTSFGSGSLSGAVRVITKKANLDGFDASVRVEGGSTDGGGIRQRYSGMVNIPVSDSAALRLVGFARDEEGYVDNVGAFGLPSEKDYNGLGEAWGARASLRWQPNERSALTFSVMHDDLEHGRAVQGANPALGLGDYTAATNKLERDGWLENDHVNLTFEYDFTWAQLVSSSTWAMSEYYWDVDLDGVDVGFPFHFDEPQDQDAFVQELRLVSSHGGKVEWLAGLFYLNRQTDSLGSIHTSPAFLDSVGVDYSGLPQPRRLASVSMDVQDRDIENNEAAIFAELTYRFTETLSLTAGVRYTEFEFDQQITAEGYTTNLFAVIGTGGVATWAPRTPDFITTGKQSATTAKFSINWQPNDDQTFYFTAAQGFRRPHPNTNALINGGRSIVDPTDTIITLAADSDELWNYELGAKTRWLDGRLQANIAAYFIDWADIQVGLTRASDGAPYSGNSGDVESTGIEAELLYWPTAKLQLGLNLTFASAEVVSLTQAQAIEAGAVKGSPLAAPETQVSGFAQYTYPLGGGGAIYGRVDVQHVDEYPNALPNVPGSPTQAPNTNFQYTDAYENVNLQVGWETAKYTLALYGENVLNNRDFVYVTPDNYTLSRFWTLRPRTIGLRADWYF